MADVFAAARCGEAVVGEWYCAGCDPAEHFQYLLAAFPGQDALGPVCAAQYFDEGLHRGRVCRVVQQDPAEVIAQGAPSTDPVAVDLAFLIAGPAGEVAGDPGALDGLVKHAPQGPGPKVA